ncbi:MAG: hypothetical protein OEV78_04610 [Spirochaetia bacterium]|nr:hypothetical protein [Spirochaetia bacterium]
MAGSINKSFIGVYKILLTLSFSKKPGVCVETGTYMGDSSLLFSKIFPKVHTIEISKKWYDFAKKRLADEKSVECHFGDSADVISELTTKIKEPVFYYLDAHFAGGDTGFGKKEVPLNEELTSISQRSYQDVIIIDDLRLIGKSGESGTKDNTKYSPMKYDWRDITFSGIAKITGRNLHNIWFFKGDRLIIFRNRNIIQGILLYFWIILGKLLDKVLVKTYKKILFLIRGR